jgi:hypothetical protein
LRGPMREAGVGGVDKKSYADELKKQMQEKKMREALAAEEIRKAEEREDRLTKDYDPWGKAGAGAPHRDAGGEIIADLRFQRLSSVNGGGQFSGITGPGAVQAYNDFYSSRHYSQPFDGVGGGGVQQAAHDTPHNVTRGLRFELNDPGRAAEESRVIEMQQQLKHDLDVQMQHKKKHNADLELTPDHALLSDFELERRRNRLFRDSRFFDLDICSLSLALAVTLSCTLALSLSCSLCMILISVCLYSI